MKQLLQEIWDNLPLKSDKGNIHSYLPVYEKLFAPYIETIFPILEIGLFNGASLLLFEKYFSGLVCGIDCSEQPHGGLADLRPLIKEGTHNIAIIDAENPVEVEKCFQDIKFNIICEDAGHDINQQLNLYSIFKKHIDKGGLYIIEDVQDIDSTKDLFLNMDDEKDITIIDLREKKGRYDDVMIILKDKA